MVPLNAARLVDQLFDVHGHQIFIDGGWGTGRGTTAAIDPIAVVCQPAPSGPHRVLQRGPPPGQHTVRGRQVGANRLRFARRGRPVRAPALGLRVHCACVRRPGQAHLGSTTPRVRQDDGLRRRSHEGAQPSSVRM